MALRHSLAILGAEGAAVALRRGEYMHVLATEGVDAAAIEGLYIPLDQSRSAQAVLSGQTYLRNTDIPAQVVHDPTGTLVRIRKIVAAPLRTPDGTIGMLVVANRQADFTDADARVLERLASQLALAVVNAFGDVLDAAGRVLAGARRGEGGFLGSAEYLAAGGAPGGALRAAHHTTLVVIATNAAADRLALGGVARAGADALARRVVPSGTAVDGDIVFACSAGTVPATPFQVEQLARTAAEMAVERAVVTAKGREGIPGLGDA
ncbi:MAG: hypothetical protein B7Z72_10565 [Gemmatimonadetes bacterium 21-71-4]|nr:MAG: hypothetical protein B7Z72_10565 [Gemmatimonadetes bacterium 21-71-4]